MRDRRLICSAVLLYTWMQIVLFGGLLSETVLIYPNVFADIPGSFDTALEFLQVTDPGAFFPPSGAATILVGLSALVLCWRARTVRYRLAASLGVFMLGNGLFSMLFAWPRNVIMFEEGPAVHATDYLEQVAHEFLLGQGLRLVASVTSATLAAAGFLAFYRRADEVIPSRDAARPSHASG